MEMSEFLVDRTEQEQPVEELDVQKAVVESLAAEKAEQDEHISNLRSQNEKMKKEISTLKGEISTLRNKLLEMSASLEKVGDILAANAEGELSSKIALLERDVEIGDRFPGEAHDHILEVLREARDNAEKEGRNRRAQILESVLCVNNPTGTLAKRRDELKKLFVDNNNILSGPVIATLEKMGISYKNGEIYLLADEIIKRTY